MNVDWHLASCLEMDTELFFMEGGSGGNDPANLRRKVCGECPIKLQCLGAALDRQEEFGIWGGTLPRERRQMIRRHLGMPHWQWPKTTVIEDEPPTECPHGHDMTSELNVIVESNGYRRCRECRRIARLEKKNERLSA